MDTIHRHVVWTFILPIVLLCSVVSSFSPKSKWKDPVDFTLLEDSVVTSSPASGGGILPGAVPLNFNVMRNPVQLHLKRNQKVQTAGVYVIRKSGKGIPVVVEQTLPGNHISGEYQDTRNNAIFTISCHNANTVAGCDPTMEGTFVSNNTEYNMRLMDENTASRIRRSAHAQNLWSRVKNVVSAANAFSKVYGIYKSDRKFGTPADFTDSEPTSNTRIAKAFTLDRKTVRENTVPGRETHNVEILAVIDYAIYQRFYKASSAPTSDEKDTDAKENIQKYFSHVMNGVDMLYKSIDDPALSLSIALTRFIIADKPSASEWTTPFRNVVVNDNDEVHIKDSLAELIRWRMRARNLGRHDHIMLFSGYEMYSISDGQKDTRTAGLAKVGAMCDMVDSASVIEDHGGFQSINTAAHELGHSLSARHDGVFNTCDGLSQFIMTSHGGFDNEENKGNQWKFSQCSVADFKNFINTLSIQNCMSNEAAIFDRAKFLEYVSLYPGQDMDPNEQCQSIMGLDSFYGWGGTLGPLEDVCTGMACYVPDTDGQYRIYKGAEGTSCGDKKWCVQGQCVFSEEAPTKDAKCVHGDSQRLFGDGQSCQERLIDFPGRCYDTFYSDKCCDTCQKLRTGVQACMHGDKFRNCNPKYCSDTSYVDGCCSTCGVAPHPVITTTPSPPTPPPTTTSTLPTTTTPSTTASSTTVTTTAAATTTPVTSTTSASPPTTVPTTTPTTPTASTTPEATTTSTKASTSVATTKVTVTTQVPTTAAKVVVTTSASVTTKATPTRADPPQKRTTTTSSTTTETTKQPNVITTQSGPIASGNSGYCLKEDGTFLIVFRCTSLLGLMGPDPCDSGLVRRYCCKPCPAQGEKACVDEPSCDVTYAKQCYVKTDRDKCCRTCKDFETNIKDCEYGDRISSCQRYIYGLGHRYVCGRYSKYCCKSCQSAPTAASTTDILSVSRGNSGTSDVTGRPRITVVHSGRGKGRGRGKGAGKSRGRGNSGSTIVLRKGRGRGKTGIRPRQHSQMKKTFKITIKRGKSARPK